ncbi:hypothetical protein Q3G72_019738 [Acer saccharum]|nr:hypothetical protein Q3G72_019738 [Acer saccharum]
MDKSKLKGAACKIFWTDDEDSKLIEALLESHKEAVPFKYKAIQYYEELCTVFGKDHANGRNAEAPTDVIEEIGRIEGDNDIGGENLNNDVDDNFVSMSF